MKFTLSWLKDHLDTNATLDEIVDGLIGVGLEVEEVERQAQAAGAFTVAYVKRSATSIPMPTVCASAMSRPDRAWSRSCAARPMPRTGMKGIFAPPARIFRAPASMLEKGVIRGVEFERHAVLRARAADLRRA